MNITRCPAKFGIYRYKLKVEFTDQDDEFNGGNLVVVMFNPATVQEEFDLTTRSRTRRRLITFSRENRYRAMTEVNLFAYRAYDKAGLLKAVRDQGISPVGRENDQVISEAVQEADRVLVGWGVVTDNPMFAKRAQEIAELLKQSGKQLYCFGKNRNGSPRNPARGRYTLQQSP